MNAGPQLRSTPSTATRSAPIVLRGKADGLRNGRPSAAAWRAMSRHICVPLSISTLKGEVWRPRAAKMGPRENGFHAMSAPRAAASESIRIAERYVYVLAISHQKSSLRIGFPSVLEWGGRASGPSLVRTLERSEGGGLAWQSARSSEARGGLAAAHLRSSEAKADWRG